MSEKASIGSRPAFPQQVCGTGLVGGGLTVREYFVAAAMVGLITCPNREALLGVAPHGHSISDAAIDIADLQIAALGAREAGHA